MIEIRYHHGFSNPDNDGWKRSGLRQVVGPRDHSDFAILPLGAVLGGDTSSPAWLCYVQAALGVVASSLKHESMKSYLGR